MGGWERQTKVPPKVGDKECKIRVVLQNAAQVKLD